MEDAIVVTYIFIIPAIAIFWFAYLLYQAYKSKLSLAIGVLIALALYSLSFAIGLPGALLVFLCFSAYFPLRLVYIVGIRADSREVSCGGGKKEITFLFAMTILSCLVAYLTIRSAGGAISG
ncbi:hypothetical protein [Candidatus Uabimicrobium amorphum]